MGFLDTVTSAFNKGTASAKRTGRLAQLRLQANDLLRQRRDLTAQLGASLYETVKEMPELRESREPLFASIEDIDQKRARIDEEIAEILRLGEKVQKPLVRSGCLVRRYVLQHVRHLHRRGKSGICHTRACRSFDMPGMRSRAFRKRSLLHGVRCEARAYRRGRASC